MNICVVGWYFHEPFLKTLAESKHSCFVVKHREGVNRNGVDHRFEVPEPIGFSQTYNVGLEFGCYDWYLKHVWKTGATLYCHDDIEVTNGALDAISELDIDQGFLFASEQDITENGGAHGRAIFCSERFQEYLLQNGGFWYDEGNHGDVNATTEKPDYHNNGIQIFRAQVLSAPKEWDVNLKCVVEGLNTFCRGISHG